MHHRMALSEPCILGLTEDLLIVDTHKKGREIEKKEIVTAWAPKREMNGFLSSYSTSK